MCGSWKTCCELRLRESGCSKGTVPEFPIYIYGRCAMLESWKARLLHLANTQPPWDFKQEFYALKTRLLEKHAAIDGHDVQHIEGKHCFRCGGSGRYSGWHGTDYCRKCEGSGWWKSPKWIVLERCRWREFVFHIPREVSRVKPEPDTTRIEGYVEHADYGDKSVLAFPTLCVLCGEWRLLWRWLNASRTCRWTHPWFALQAVVTTVRWKLSDLRRRCRCGRRTWSSSRMICRKCRKEAERSSELILSEQVPF